MRRRNSFTITLVAILALAFFLAVPLVSASAPLVLPDFGYTSRSLSTATCLVGGLSKGSAYTTSREAWASAAVPSSSSPG